MYKWNIIMYMTTFLSQSINYDQINITTYVSIKRIRNQTENPNWHPVSWNVLTRCELHNRQHSIEIRQKKKVFYILIWSSRFKWILITY